jgi:hypothetical protein
LPALLFSAPPLMLSLLLLLLLFSLFSSSPLSTLFTPLPPLRHCRHAAPPFQPFHYYFSFASFSMTGGRHFRSSFVIAIDAYAADCRHFHYVTFRHYLRCRAIARYFTLMLMPIFIIADISLSHADDIFAGYADYIVFFR